MLSDHFKSLHFPLSWIEFLKLPRHPAYRYEYQSGYVTISGNPRYRHARLDLSRSASLPGREPAGGELMCFFSNYELQTISPADWRELPKLFAAAFSRTPPFSALTGDEQTQAAIALLNRTESGLDGPWLPQASRLICERDSGTLLGAILVTLVPAADPEDFTSADWKSPAPPNAVETRWGQPHLTWIFISPDQQRKQLGTVLLRTAATGTRSAGYSHLLSTFLIGDSASTLWHWKNGFELVNAPGL